MQKLLVGFALVLVACGGDGKSITGGVDLTSPSDLVGSYSLAVYNATPSGNNPGGTLTLRSDSTFTLSVNAAAWGTKTGSWSWIGHTNDIHAGAVLLHPSNISGSFDNGGLGFTEPGLPALLFRKN